MSDSIQVNETVEDSIRKNLEEILSISLPYAKSGNLDMAKINSKADECIKLVDYIRSK